MTFKDVALELQKLFLTYELPDLPISKMMEVVSVHLNFTFKSSHLTRFPVLETFKKRMSAPGSDPTVAHPAIRLYVRSAVRNNPAVSASSVRFRALLTMKNHGLAGYSNDEAEHFCRQFENCLMCLVYTQLQGGFEKTAVFSQPFSS